MQENRTLSKQIIEMIEEREHCRALGDTAAAHSAQGQLRRPVRTPLLDDDERRVILLGPAPAALLLAHRLTIGS